MSSQNKLLRTDGLGDGLANLGNTFDPSDGPGLGLGVIPGGPSANPSGLFAYGDAGSGSVGTLNLKGASGAAPTPTLVATAGSNLKIDIVWDSSVASAPTAFMTAVIAAAQSFEANFTNAVTVNLDIGYGEIAGGAMASGALGESESYLQSVSYAALLAALATHNSDATTAAVLASLPLTAPVSGTIWVTTAQAKALGLSSANGTGLDGYIGLASTYPFTYNSSSGVAAGSYDFNGVISHEITEVMGRMLLTGGTVGTYTKSDTLLDLLHYSALGVRDFSASTAGYFSPDGGGTNGGNFNTVSGGDAGDWASSMGTNAFDAFSGSGVINAVTSGDITELNAIGWTLNTAGTPTPTPTPSPVVPPPGGIAIAPIEASLAATQTASGLAANSPLAKLTATGGVAGDPVVFQLGGTGASAFRLTAGAGNTAALSTGGALLTGGTNGRLYALTLTATDTTTGLSSTPSSVDVVVAGPANDTVPIETIVGSASRAAPTFVYGLAGNDTLNGVGMTGRLWFDGGAGADTMIGGSGSNTYLYNAASDSTASAMDVIANFTASKDYIDLTGIGSTHLSYLGLTFANTLAADSVAWQRSGLNTFLYVNTSGRTESLSAASMKIELNGWQTIGSNNILHN